MRKNVCKIRKEPFKPHLFWWTFSLLRSSLGRCIHSRLPKWCPGLRDFLHLPHLVINSLENFFHGRGWTPIMICVACRNTRNRIPPEPGHGSTARFVTLDIVQAYILFKIIRHSCHGTTLVLMDRDTKRKNIENEKGYFFKVWCAFQRWARAGNFPDESSRAFGNLASRVEPRAVIWNSAIGCVIPSKKSSITSVENLKKKENGSRAQFYQLGSARLASFAYELHPRPPLVRSCLKMS